MLLAGAAAFVATSIAAYLSLDDLLARDRVREHARQVQLLMRRTGTLLVDMETGQRGFIITGLPAFLEPYSRAVQEFDGTYAALKQQLALDGDETAEMMARLDKMSSRRLAQVSRNIDRRKELGEQALHDLPGFLSGKQLMDDIRRELARLEEVQDERVRQANLGTQAVSERTVVLAVALPAVGCTLIILVSALLRNEHRRRDQAESALQKANHALEGAVAERTEQLRAALDRNRDYTAQLDASIEAERKQLAREVHDQIGQIGTATKMLVLGLRGRLPSGHESDLQELITLADENIATARSISAALRPPLLDDFGLRAALDHYAQSLARRGEIAVHVDLEGEAALSPAQANSLFRIVQEACTNVLRHAQAQRLQLLGRPVEGYTAYQLEIIDDGKGPGDVRADASGLRNMRERAAMLNGRFEFGPAKGPSQARGTRIGVILPINVVQPKRTEAAP